MTWIEQAEKVLNAREALDGANQRSHGRVISIFLLAAALVLSILMAYLLFVRVSTTSIEATIQAGTVRFVATKGFRIAPLQRLKRVAFRGAHQSAELPPEAPDGASRVVALEGFRVNDPDGRLAVSPAEFEMATEMTIEARPEEDQYWFRLNDKSAGGSLPSLVLSLPPKAAMEGVDWQPAWANKRLLVRPANTLSVTLSPQAPLLGGENWPLPIESISFASADLPSQKFRTGRPISSLQSASIRCTSLDGKNLELQQGELLKMEIVRGSILGVSFNAENLIVRLEATVRELTTGHGATERSHMPRTLQQWRANSEVQLYSVSVATLFSIAAVFLRWLKGVL